MARSLFWNEFSSDMADAMPRGTGVSPWDRATALQNKTHAMAGEHLSRLRHGGPLATLRAIYAHAQTDRP